MKVEVVPYDPTWRDAFVEEAKDITAALGGAIRETIPTGIAAIHHIGSTAIPSIYAKPIVNLLV